MRGLSEAGRFARFAVVGGVNTVVHYLVYLATWLWIGYLVAHVLATITAMSVSYLLNCRYTFRVRPRLRTFLVYPASNCVNLAISATTMWLLVEVARVHPLLATLLGGLVATPATYLVTRLILTSRNRAPRPGPGESLPLGRTS
ncbi:GtrA family protein [Saccharopolyspora flava]|uniref:Putative flippase GtrA (Transmembrane translocase of bactoprenol-linked glucose) n=1 Tax=Saccharopolyspora flava TaxID=95161 RepID=A0A1I6S9X6_9PSEU|nr:GtrA family protein [Saccharopolyspora flava]SFS73746.1 Putative flippase GtrA (transmembrane translocase of bactoprenol-linked glucose) [Saccharopolyspora flava]